MRTVLHVAIVLLAAFGGSYTHSAESGGVELKQLLTVEAKYVVPPDKALADCLAVYWKVDVDGTARPRTRFTRLRIICVDSAGHVRLEEQRQLYPVIANQQRTITGITYMPSTYQVQGMRLQAIITGPLVILGTRPDASSELVPIRAPHPATLQSLPVVPPTEAQKITQRVFYETGPIMASVEAKWTTFPVADLKIDWDFPLTLRKGRAPALKVEWALFSDDGVLLKEGKAGRRIRLRKRNMYEEFPLKVTVQYSCPNNIVRTAHLYGTIGMDPETMRVR